ncbi:hypothetical protein [Vibrio gallaecicus]|uniref:Uncharacterized protein n=1 Tax=Vibrio gallaecicus TaxID=552386 RepID=A0ABV4NEJ3_9VIBR
MKKNLLLGLPFIVLSPWIHANESPQLAVGMAFDQQLSVVVEVDDTYRVTAGNDGMAFDYILKRGVIDPETSMSWYVGVGAWNEWNDVFGARVPLGMNVNFYDGWNLYAQVHPELNLYKGPELQLSGALGITYKF